MTDIFPELPRPLGDYTLIRLLELRGNTALYEATQSHVDRAVVLEVLRPGAGHTEEVAFLAQARLRVASSELPHVAHVYESLRAEGMWFLTQGLPQGSSLAALAAAGQPLSVPHICRVIAAAAEMYTPCYQAELSAMPLAPSSMFIEPDGEVHFLSPLIEGTENDPAAQMSALAQALWPLVPQEKEPGLGRAVTLLQWLTDGYEGKLLDWSTLGDTAQSILEQLRSEAPAEPAQSSISNILSDKRQLRKIRKATARWGAYIGGAAAVIIGMSCLGTLYGMADPVKMPAENETSFLCRDGNSYEQVSRQPVSVSDYQKFLQEFNAMSESEREQLLANAPLQAGNPTPGNWEAQLEEPEKPVTGVSYWQAELYARVAGGQLPTAGQVQAVLSAGATPCELEWTRTVETSPLPGVYNGSAVLLIDAQAHPFPIESRNWQSASCGFRITLPYK